VNRKKKGKQLKIVFGSDAMNAQFCPHGWWKCS